MNRSKELLRISSTTSERGPAKRRGPGAVAGAFEIMTRRKFESRRVHVHVRAWSVHNRLDQVGRRVVQCGQRRDAAKAFHVHTVDGVFVRLHARNDTPSARVIDAATTIS